MAKKPSRVYEPGEVQPGAKPESVGKPTVKTHGKTETVISKGTERVYHDGTDQDRLSITQRAVEYTQKHATRVGAPQRSKYDELLSCIYDSVIITNSVLNGRVVPAMVTS